MGLFDFIKRKELDTINELTNKLERYEGISSIENEIERLSIQKKDIEVESNRKIDSINSSVNELNNKYQASLDTYTKLRTEVSVYEAKLGFIEYGVYEPVYDFEKSDDYRIEQDKIIELQKNLIKDDLAAICTKEWQVEGSKAKGNAIVKVYKKLMLRAFNGEADVLISKVKWNNIKQSRERIEKLFDSINKLGNGFSVYINDQYVGYKIKELILEYEYQAKKQKEKEELRAIQEELREEEKAKREYEQAQREAEKEENTYQNALDKARKEIALYTGAKYDLLYEKIAILEKDLIEAQLKKERALSMAQQTKRGHIYIISNIGSFGENVYKIGMTRRLEPTDRVKELGDASVPFNFDIHAMIYTDEAPALEYELHKAFSDKKVNMLNYRKEFFNVSMEDIRRKVDEIGIKAEFSLIPEAEEYRETLAIINKLKNPDKLLSIEEQIRSDFPSSLL